MCPVCLSTRVRHSHHRCKILYRCCCTPNLCAARFVITVSTSGRGFENLTKFPSASVRNRCGSEAAEWNAESRAKVSHLDHRHRYGRPPKNPYAPTPQPLRRSQDYVPSKKLSVR